jgi:hypothetical protein
MKEADVARRPNQGGWKGRKPGVRSPQAGQILSRLVRLERSVERLAQRETRRTKQEVDRAKTQEALAKIRAETLRLRIENGSYFRGPRPLRRRF